MEQRGFGDTGLEVSALGLGAGQIGRHDVDEEDVAALLAGALDLGVTLIDTARGYGSSEERIGRHLARRRDEFVLSSKGGYDIPGQADWTAGAVTASIERLLRLTRSERIDVFHLHSCPVEVLDRGDLQDALDQAVAAGKIGVAAYSGDNEHLEHAVRSGRFGSIETSINLADQWNLRHVVASTESTAGLGDEGRDPGLGGLDGLDHRILGAAGLGVIAKRPIANAPWRFEERPVGDYSEPYWERLRTLQLDPGPLEWDELALRFTAFAPGVHSAIVGTSKLVNLSRNVAAVERGPLPTDVLAAIDAAWARVGEEWPSLT